MEQTAPHSLDLVEAQYIGFREQAAGAGQMQYSYQERFTGQLGAAYERQLGQQWRGRLRQLGVSVFPHFVWEQSP